MGKSYYIDCEFNAFGGELVSFALVSESGASYYAIFDCPQPVPWVAENVIPILRSVPSWVEIREPTREEAASEIASFLREDNDPTIICDWPEDIIHFCRLLIVGPGIMANIPKLNFKIVRVDTYGPLVPVVVGAVEHNAFWDAQALKAYCETWDV